MKKIAFAVLLSALLAPGLALAYDHDRHDNGHHGGPDRHGSPHGNYHRDNHWSGDIHHFNDRDLGYWHTGRWWHGVHGGRSGWWWTLGGAYYYYPAPIYPYPDPYVPPAVVAAPVAPGPVWYFCRNPRGYYPYVPACYVPWRVVQGF